MIERTLTLPADTDEVWEALVDPEIVGNWFGADVSWDLSPGGAMEAVEDDGSRRHGVVKSISKGRHLQFEWWPSDDASSASEVTYTLESVDDGSTALTITERQTTSIDAQMSIAIPVTSWTPIDDVSFRIWAAVAAPLVYA